MNFEKRIIAFAKLGEFLRKPSNEILSEAIEKASKHNGWFTKKNVLLAINSLGEMLEEEKLRKWVSLYSLVPRPSSLLPKKIGVIMAGNIPLVGFHDFLCVLMSGNIFIGKLSSDDKFLLPAVSEILCEIEPEFKSQISPHRVTESVFHRTNLSAQSDGVRHSADKSPIKSADAFISTGSNNSTRYFEYYFGKYPHIIRKNRNAVAMIDGNETTEDLINLGKDIFQYFGLGCRSVSKIFIPQDYDLDKFFSAIVDYGDVIHHNKYYNNYIYYRTIYLLNKEKFLDNNFLMLKEDDRIASPVATLYYERYKSKEELFQKIEDQKENIQCIVSTSPLFLSLYGEGLVRKHSRGSPADSFGGVRHGQTQSPELWDYADGVDTMKFLISPSD